jgi:hypothetical protein
LTPDPQGIYRGALNIKDDVTGPDRVRNGIQLSPDGFVWTMVMLNVTMGQVSGDDRWDEWWKEPSVPALLRDKVRNPASFL